MDKTIKRKLEKPLFVDKNRMVFSSQRWPLSCLYPPLRSLFRARGQISFVAFVLLAHLMNVARQKTGYRQKPSGTVVSFKPCSPPTVHAPHCPLRPSHHGGEQSLQPLCSPALERTTPCHPQRRLRTPVQIKLRTHLFQSASPSWSSLPTSPVSDFMLSTVSLRALKGAFK